MVEGKRNIAIVATTTDGDVFGGFYSVAVWKLDKYFVDPNIFIFSFESRGRCETPKRFPASDLWKDGAYVSFYKNDSYGRFVVFDGGSGRFFLGNEKTKHFCFNLACSFYGIEDTTLTGNDHRESFTCCRLVAVHLE